MSGTGTHPIFTVQVREPVSEQRVASLSRLADRVREMTEAVIHTELPEDEVAEVAAQVEALTARLNAVRRDLPPVNDTVDGGMLQQLAGPVNGVLNPIAPPVPAEILPDGSVRSEFTLNAVYEGPPGLVHGGVSAMILDQLLGLAANGSGKAGLTATLELRYRRPTMLNEPLTVEARIDRVEGRKTHAVGRIINAEGRTTIDATAMFVMPL